MWQNGELVLQQVIRTSGERVQVDDPHRDASANSVARILNESRIFDQHRMAVVHYGVVKGGLDS
jgi:hypothetical protein